VVDYFLFDSKQGFCDYYATAMVVLARSAGIPARPAFGFATGTFDPSQGKYTVLQSDAHAWPELYFPGIGWVEFEPTAVMAEIPRPAGAVTAVTNPVLPQPEDTGSSTGWRWLVWLLRWSAVPALILLMTIPLAVLAWNLSAPFRFRMMAPSRVIHSVFRRLQAHGIRQGIRLFPGITPQEFTGQLARKNPACAAPLSLMEEIYSRQLYSGKGISREDRRQIIRNWPGIDRQLWTTWWNGRLQAFRNLRLAGRRAEKGAGRKGRA
jgi:hypothetical protein